MTSTTRAILIPKCDLIITIERKEIHSTSDFTTVNTFEKNVHISRQLFYHSTFPENQKITALRLISVNNAVILYLFLCRVAMVDPQLVFRHEELVKNLILENTGC